MFRKMRRQDRCLLEEDAKKVLLEGKYGIVSLVGNDGYPYGVPMHYVVNNQKVYFHTTSTSGLKAELIKQNSKVSFAVVETNDGIKCRSVICFGDLIEVSDKRQFVLEQFVEKFVPPFAWEQAKSGIKIALDNINAYELNIKHISGKWVDKPEGK